MTTRQLSYITFKGIYIASAATYFLCDFYRNPGNSDYHIVVDVMGKDKTELCFVRKETAASWEYTPDLEAPVPAELIDALTDKIAFLEDDRNGLLRNELAADMES